MYLDDIIFFLATIEEHSDHVGNVLTALGKSGISLNIGKFQCFTIEVNLIGHIVRLGTIELNQEAINS